MSSVNSILLIGNLGADPETKTTATGKVVGNFSMATSKTWTDGQGQRQEKTSWHRVIVWGKTAELVQRYLTKGRKVCVQGEIDYRSWDDQKTGEKRYMTEIIAQQVTFLDSGNGREAEPRDNAGGGYGGGGSRGGGGYGQGNAGGGRGASGQADNAGGFGGGNDDYYKDTVPF